MEATRKMMQNTSRKQFLFALRQMVLRGIKRRYARSYLGIVWSVLNPLMMMAVMSLIFTAIFKREIENYPIYFLTGQILWHFFSASTNSAMGALVDNKGLLMKVKLPKQIFVLARVLTEFTNLGYTCIAYVFMLIVFQVKPSLYMLLFPVIVFLFALFTTGISYILSILYVHFADIQHLYSVFMRLLMYMTALFYPVDSVAPALKRVIEMNPTYAFIYCARECVVYGRCPEFNVWLQIILWAVGMFAVGYFVFKKNENTVMQKV